MSKEITKSAKIAAIVLVTSALTVGVSVLATSIGSSISVDTTLSVTGASTFTGAVNASSTAQVTGNLTTYGNSTFGDASSDINLFTGTLQASTTALFTGAMTLYNNITFANNATATIPSAATASFNIATSSASIPFLKFDTSNYLIGISTTSPAVTLSVGGAGNVYALGGLGVGVATTTAGSIEASGVIQGAKLSVNGDATIKNLTITNSTTTNATSTNLTVTSAASTSVLTVSGGLGSGISTTTAGALQTTGPNQLGGALNVGGASTFNSTVAVGSSGTALAQVLQGTVVCGPVAGSQSIAATSTGVIACTTGLSNVNAADNVFLTATTTQIVSGGSVIYTGKASTTAANFVQAELMNLTGAAWTVTTSSWKYLIIR